MEDISVYDFYLPPGDGGSSQELPPVIPVTQMNILDLPAFPHDNPSDSFLTLATVALGPNWKGAVSYRSDDGGEAGGNSYNLLTPVTNQSIMGIATSVLGNGNAYTWDNANTVDIILMGGELSSVNELAMLNGGKPHHCSDILYGCSKLQLCHGLCRNHQRHNNHLGHTRSSSMQVNQIVGLNSTQAVAVWRDSGDSSRCKAAVLSVSGTSISVGTIVTVNATGMGGWQEIARAAEETEGGSVVIYRAKAGIPSAG